MFARSRRRRTAMDSKTAIDSEPPHSQVRPDFERIALLLQGGGALGSYQGGVYQALAEADLHPHWVAGISIGAINAALIAGNPPERRVERLREFWETVTQGPFGTPYLVPGDIKNDMVHQLLNQGRAVGALLWGAPSFFKPRFPPPFFLPTSSPGNLSFYDVSPLRTLLGRLVDFDRVNSGAMRLSVGATNVKSGNAILFDSVDCRIGVDQIVASGSLPPGFPATEIDGQYYWDGGVVSNTPLQWVFDSQPRQDTLAFQIDLWSARGELPRDMIEVDTRLKDIRYSSRTRMGTDHFRKMQALRRATAKLLSQIPEELRHTPEAELLAAAADDKVYNIIQMIYRARVYEGASKDYEFSRRTMDEHWKAGYADMTRTLAYPEVLQRPTSPDGVFTFDLKRQPGE
jgi:NTE family protein